MDRPSLGDFSVDVRSKAGTRPLSFTLLSLPLYLAGQIDRLIREQLSQTAR